jgi:hypothetical protein
MMACVSSLRYQVRFNSDETDMFTSTRGLHQGTSSLHISSFYMVRVYLVYCCMKNKLVVLLG